MSIIGKTIDDPESSIGHTHHAIQKNKWIFYEWKSFNKVNLIVRVFVKPIKETFTIVLAVYGNDLISNVKMYVTRIIRT